MTAPDTLPAADRRRAAQILLACLDGDGAASHAVMDECDAAPGGLAGLVAALASGALELLIAAAGPDGARKTLNMSLLDAQVDGDD